MEVIDQFTYFKDYFGSRKVRDEGKGEGRKISEESVVFMHQ